MISNIISLKSWEAADTLSGRLCALHEEGSEQIPAPKNQQTINNENKNIDWCIANWQSACIGCASL
jgi:hypothetical protein